MPQHERYLDAILAELRDRAASFSGALVSIYLGGGTPSLWRPDCIARAIAAITATFSRSVSGLADGGGTPREVTIEANPTDCTAEQLRAWRDAGVNRVSIGVQSLVAGELVMLGRDHRFGDGPAALERVLAAGGFTTSCDFILGVPPSRAFDIHSITNTAVDHLSIYELTIEDRTSFGKQARSGKLVPLDEDALADLYIATHHALAAAGFEHYEISSYARPGKRAIHNSLYWRGVPFLGLGVGAASLAIAADGSAERATNPRLVDEYLAAPGTPAEIMRATPAELASERAWLGMRTSDGVAETDLAHDVVSWLLDEGLAERRAARICPTLRGFLMADRIAARITDARRLERE